MVGNEPKVRVAIIFEKKENPIKHKHIGNFKFNDKFLFLSWVVASYFYTCMPEMYTLCFREKENKEAGKL